MPQPSPAEAKQQERTAAAALKVPLLDVCWSKIFDFADLKTFGRMRRCSREWHRIASLPTSSTVLSKTRLVVSALELDATGGRLTAEMVQAYLLRRLKSCAWPVAELKWRGVEALFENSQEAPLPLTAAETRLLCVGFEVLNNIAAEIVRLRAIGTPEERRMLALASASSNPTPPSVLEQLADRFLKLQFLSVLYTNIGDPALLFEALSPTLLSFNLCCVRPGGAPKALRKPPAFLLPSVLQRLVVQTFRRGQSSSSAWLDHTLNLVARYGANLEVLELTIDTDCSAAALEQIHAFNVPKLAELKIYLDSKKQLPIRAFAGLATLPLRRITIINKHPVNAPRLRALAGEVDSATEAEWQQKLRAAQASGSAPHLDGVSAQSLLKRCASSLESLEIGQYFVDLSDADILALNFFRRLRRLQWIYLNRPLTLAQFRLLDRALPLEFLVTQISKNEQFSNASALVCHDYLAAAFPTLLQRLTSDLLSNPAFPIHNNMEPLQLAWCSHTDGTPVVPRPNWIWRDPATRKMSRMELDRSRGNYPKMVDIKALD